MPNKTRHLPATPEELRDRGWDAADVILITGDAHADHPSFPAALLGRVLEAEGFRVAVISRPLFKTPDDIARLGAPKLFFGVTAGSLDSMVGNYTALKKRRSDDPYAPGGKAGGRPDRALTVYCNLIRQAFGKSAFIVAGGLEASLRRFIRVFVFAAQSFRHPRRETSFRDHGHPHGPGGEIQSFRQGAIAKTHQRIDEGRSRARLDAGFEDDAKTTGRFFPEIPGYAPPVFQGGWTRAIRTALSHGRSSRMPHGRHGISAKLYEKTQTQSGAMPDFHAHAGNRLHSHVRHGPGSCYDEAGLRGKGSAPKAKAKGYDFGKAG